MINLLNYLFALSLAIEPLSTKDVFLIFGFSITQILIIPNLIILILIGIINKKRYGISLQSLGIYGIIILYTISINAFYADYSGAYKTGSTLIFCFLCLVYYNIAYEEKYFSYGILSGLFITSLSFLWRFYSGDTMNQYFLYSDSATKVTGLIHDTNSSALIIFLLLAMFSRSSKMLYTSPKLFWSICLGATAIGLLSFSRTYFLTVGIWVIIWGLKNTSLNKYSFARKKNRSVFVFSSILLIAAIAYLYSTGYINLMQERFSYDLVKRGHFFGKRYEIWSVIFNEHLFSVFIGGGFNSYLEKNYYYPHNSYIELALYGGIPLLLWFVYLIKNGVKQLFSLDQRKILFSSYFIVSIIFIFTLSMLYKILFAMMMMAFIPQRTITRN